MMKNRLNHIKNVYQQNDILKRLSQHTQLLAQLNHVLQQSLPPQYSAHCRLANIKDDTLIIHTDNASLASMVRFQAPILCKTLSDQLDRSFSKIIVKVKPHHIPLNNPNTNMLSMPENAARTIQQTAHDLEDGSLKTALEKLAKRHS
ncbi:MAG: DUF721 domain-containing protein [Gammaproteobacteria bacterium]|nr:DUF721 domain-containing protein [Gammaproteobacteria bacterium]